METNKPKAVFPGSFDPFTKAHFEILSNAMDLFDVTVLVAVNPSKGKGMFTPHERMYIIKSLGKDVNVEFFDGLITDYCSRNHIDYIIRGMRPTNVEELNLAQIYYSYSGVKTIIIPNYKPEHNIISSTLVREYISKKGQWEPLVPKNCIKIINNYLNYREYEKSN